MPRTAPRPFYQLTDRAYRLGMMSIPRGQWAFLNRTPYRQRRRRQPERQFHALGARGAQMNTIVRAALVYGLGAIAVRPLAGPAEAALRPFQCPKCGYDYVAYINHQMRCLICAAVVPFTAPASDELAPSSPRRRHTHPLWKPWIRPMYGWDQRCIRGSRYNPRTYRPRPRTKFALRRGTLHYLAVRRRAAAQCAALGMQQLRPGVWYDSLADVMYAQLSAPAGSELWGQW
jgi:hypothetical protein